jgi:hypothetical protein
MMNQVLYFLTIALPISIAVFIIINTVLPFQLASSQQDMRASNTTSSIDVLGKENLIPYVNESNATNSNSSNSSGGR